MPASVSEITSGAQYTKNQPAQGQGQDTATRVFRVLLSTPGEVVDPQDACGVTVGSSHPNYQGLLCTSADIRFDGESRMAVLCTFQYQGANSQQQEQSQQPGTEQANWSLSSSLIEQPAYWWRKRTDSLEWAAESPAVNSAGDIYEAITQLNAMINISITQRQIGQNPITHLTNVGSVNQEKITLGTLEMQPHTVMFRGLQAQPFVTDWRGTEHRGWQCTYEFAYKPNKTKIMLNANQGGGQQEATVFLGWDIAVPQTGFNVKAFTPPGDATQDQFGQPLKHADSGPIILNNGVGQLFEGLAPGNKCRAMVRVFSYQGGGASQAPSASPIPLNDDGTPRRETANPKVIVYGYSVQPELNFTQTFGLRLQ